MTRGPPDGPSPLRGCPGISKDRRKVSPNHASSSIEVSARYRHLHLCAEGSAVGARRVVVQEPSGVAVSVITEAELRLGRPRVLRRSGPLGWWGISYGP